MTRVSSQVNCVVAAAGLFPFLDEAYRCHEKTRPR